MPLPEVKKNSNHSSPKYGSRRKSIADEDSYEQEGIPPQVPRFRSPFGLNTKDRSSPRFMPSFRKQDINSSSSTTDPITFGQSLEKGTPDLHLFSDSSYSPSSSEQQSPSLSNNAGDEEIDPNFEQYVPSPLSLDSQTIPTTNPYIRTPLHKSKTKLNIFKRYKYKPSIPNEKDYSSSTLASRTSLSNKEDNDNESRFSSVLSLGSDPMDGYDTYSSDQAIKNVKARTKERGESKGVRKKINLFDRFIRRNTPNNISSSESPSPLLSSSSKTYIPPILVTNSLDSSPSELKPVMSQPHMVPASQGSFRESPTYILHSNKDLKDDNNNNILSSNPDINCFTKEKSLIAPAEMIPSPLSNSLSSSNMNVKATPYAKKERLYKTDNIRRFSDGSILLRADAITNNHTYASSSSESWKNHETNIKNQLREFSDSKCGADLSDQYSGRMNMKNKNLLTVADPTNDKIWCPSSAECPYPTIGDIADRSVTPPAIPNSHGFSNEIHFEMFGPIKNLSLEQRNKISYLRIYRGDGSFGTVTCTLETTVKELIQTLARKFFILSVKEAQLVLKTSAVKQILDPNDRPLAYQLIYLELMGYTSRDNLENVGREDITYLCQFTLVEENESEKNEDRLQRIISSQSIPDVNLHNCNLRTIPTILFKNASLIENLNLSRNPSIIIPLSFIKGCTNLKRLEFSQNRIRRFPGCLAEMTYLKTLDLSANYIRSLPEMLFSRMSNLETLQLKGNKLANLPSTFKNLAESLIFLDLSSNYFDHFPPNVCQMGKLKHLDISFNRILTIPDNVSTLTNLQQFYLNNNALINRLPVGFASLVSLKVLDIKYNYLTDIDIISKLPSLEKLVCSRNNVSRFSDQLSSQLTTLYLNQNPISEINFTSCASSLSFLDASGAKLGSLSSSLINMIPNVETLILDNNHLNLIPTEVWNLKKLKFLSCANNNLESLPDDIGKLISLEYLDLHSNNICELPSEINELYHLRHLNLASNLLDEFPKCGPSILNLKEENSPLNTHQYFLESLKLNQGREDNIDVVNSPRRMSVVSNELISPDSFSHRASITPHSSAVLPLSTFPSISGSLPESEPDINSSDLSTFENLDQLKESLANSLQVLILCDNRFNDDCFENISLLTELKVLNISYNYLIEIPSNSLSRLKKLTELYVSGNSLSSLPADDLESIPHLQTLFANFNKLHSLPAELGKNFELRMFDVGSNNLKYNINNWPYDWNWHFNLGLKYLNFSGNKRLEIKSVRNSGQFINTFYDHKDLSDFMILSQIRVLGLMDVTLTTSSVPDQSENCRVRTYGSEIKDIPFGMADTLGDDENLSIIDLVIEQFRGNEREIILGIFDGQNQGPIGGNKISKLVQENFGAVFIHELKKMRNDDTVADALRRAFLCTNRDIGLAVFTPSGEKNLNAAAHRSSTAAHASYDDGLSGSCGTVCYIQDRKVYVANIGDTMAIVATSAGEYHVLTHRHDICGTSEFAHIRAGGGFIDSNGRLAGVTTVSRAFGFYNLIPYLMAGPTITEYDLTDLDELIIIGSRELWDYMSYESVVDIALTEVEDPMNAANKLRDFAISYGSKEKIMVMCISVGGASRRKKQKMMMKMASGSISTPVGHAPVTSLLNNDEMYPLIRRRPHDRNLLPEDSMLARLGGEVNAPIGQLAMVFTDIQKSTQLWETHPIAMRSAIKIHNAVMRRQLRIVGGYEVKTEGDAFMVSFSTAPSALLWCLNVQAQLLVAEWPAEILQCPEAGELASGSGVMIYKGLLVRMGIHWGSPVCERDPITKRMDYYGPMVNRAARIGAKADGGQIMVSADFLSEMKRIQSIYKTQECNGGFISVKDEDTMKKIETNGGYVLNEVGETKLKGLENAEFLSLIFSKHLIDRADYPPSLRDIAYSRQDELKITDSSKEGGKTRQNPLTVISTRVNTISPSQEVFFDTIGVQSLLRIRDVSLRLEKICSRLNGKQTTSDHLSTGILPISNKSTPDLLSACGSKWVSASLPPTQQRLISLMDHVVTRIENSLVMLYLRISLAKSDKLEAKTNDDISIPNEEIDETSNFDLTLLDRDNQYSIDRLIHTIQSLVPQISQVNKA